jgi:hypothetical protein
MKKPFIEKARRISELYSSFLKIKDTYNKLILDAEDASAQAKEAFRLDPDKGNFNCQTRHHGEILYFDNCIRDYKAKIKRAESELKTEINKLR